MGVGKDRMQMLQDFSRQWDSSFQLLQILPGKSTVTLNLKIAGISLPTPLLASVSKLAVFLKHIVALVQFFLLFKKYNHKQTSKTTRTLVKVLLILLDMSNHEKQKQDLGWGGGHWFGFCNRDLLCNPGWLGTCLKTYKDYPLLAPMLGLKSRSWSSVRLLFVSVKTKQGCFLTTTEFSRDSRPYDLFVCILVLYRNPENI